MALQTNTIKGKLGLVTAGKIQYEVMLSYDTEDAEIVAKLKGLLFYFLYSIQSHFVKLSTF